MASDPHAGQPVLSSGARLAEARAAMIMVHGRGAGAANILSLAEEFARPDIAYIAPQAAGSVWYPLSFLAPREANQPYLDSALGVLEQLTAEIGADGIAQERIILLGFSQGGCLALDFAARHGGRFGGVAALSGGLIGETVEAADYGGDLAATPVLLGCSDIDPHIPLERVRRSAEICRGLGAAVDERIYPGMGHTVNPDEVLWVRALLDQVAPRA
jgi:predicted esterase